MILDITAEYHNEKSITFWIDEYVDVWTKYFNRKIRIVIHFSNMRKTLKYDLNIFPMILFTNDFGCTHVESDKLKYLETLFDDTVCFVLWYFAFVSSYHTFLAYIFST